MLNEADKMLPITEKRVKNHVYYQGKLAEYTDLNDNYHGLEAYLNYLETKPPDMIIREYMIERAFWNYFYMGFPERARDLSIEKWELDHDTVQYLMRTGNVEFFYGSKDSTLKIGYQLHKRNASYFGHLYITIQIYNERREHAKALDSLKKMEEKVLQVVNSVSPNYNVFGYTYFVNGMKEKADYHFKGSIKRAEDEIKLHSASAKRYDSHFRLAIIYAILNEKQKSLQYLGMIKASRSVPITFIQDLKTNLMFDNVRNEPEFQKITGELEKKYLDEHEKIKKLLKRHGLEPA